MAIERPHRRRGLVLIGALIACPSVAPALQSPPIPDPLLSEVHAVELDLSPRCNFEEFTAALAVIRDDVVARMTKGGIEVVDDAAPGSPRPDSVSFAITVQCMEIRRRGSSTILGESPADPADGRVPGPWVFHVTGVVSKWVPTTSGEGRSTLIWSMDWLPLGLESKRPFVTLREQVLRLVDVFVTEVVRARSMTPKPPEPQQQPRGRAH